MIPEPTSGSVYDNLATFENMPDILEVIAAAMRDPNNLKAITPSTYADRVHDLFKGMIEIGSIMGLEINPRTIVGHRSFKAAKNSWSEYAEYAVSLGCPCGRPLDLLKLKDGRYVFGHMEKMCSYLVYGPSITAAIAELIDSLRNDTFKFDRESRMLPSVHPNPNKGIDIIPPPSKEPQ